jgi:uncharacterized protein (TIGR00251 family)
MAVESPSQKDFANAVTRSSGGTLVEVWAVPGAATTGITGLHGTALRIRVSAPPEGGKANRALQKVLADLTSARVELVRGAGSRRKWFLVEGLEPADVVRHIVRQTG